MGRPRQYDWDSIMDGEVWALDFDPALEPDERTHASDRFVNAFKQEAYRRNLAIRYAKVAVAREEGPAWMRVLVQVRDYGKDDEFAPVFRKAKRGVALRACGVCGGTRCGCEA